MAKRLDVNEEAGQKFYWSRHPKEKPSVIFEKIVVARCFFTQIRRESKKIKK
jgi:hypothetical protein